jgi:very-short-patch-repair endonuclease
MDATRFKARQLRNSATGAERHLWWFLRNRQPGGYRFRRQVPLAGYIADFVCPELRLVVELDGGQHLDQAEADMRRTRVLEGVGYRVLRYWNNDVLGRTPDVLEDILRAMEAIKSTRTPPRPAPALRARAGAQQEGES